MGNDGGSIPTRRELVKEAARNPSTADLKQAAAEAEQHRWTTDPLSNKSLLRPIVSDAAGWLYCKDELIRHLLSTAAGADDDVDVRRKEAESDVLRGRIHSLKDVVELIFEVEEEGQAERWVCPITRDPLGPGSRAVYLVPCGHVFKGDVIREAGGESACLQCNEPYAPDGVIPIIPTADADIARLQLRAKKLREKGLTHSLKEKAPSKKKRKKNGEAQVTKAANRQEGETEKGAMGQAQHTATASMTVGISTKREERNKRQRMTTGHSLNGLYSPLGYTRTESNVGFESTGLNIPSKAKH